MKWRGFPVVVVTRAWPTKMDNVNKIGILLVTNYWLANGILVTNGSSDSFHYVNPPSRRYLPPPQPAPEHSGRGDINVFPENDLQVIPLGGQPRGNVYLPALSNYPLKFTESRPNNFIKFCDVRNINNLERIIGLPFLKDVVTGYMESEKTKNPGNGYPRSQHIFRNNVSSSDSSTISRYYVHQDVSRNDTASLSHKTLDADNKSTPTSVSRISRYRVHESSLLPASRKVTEGWLEENSPDEHSFHRDEYVKPVFERNEYLPDDHHDYRKQPQIVVGTSYPTESPLLAQLTPSKNSHHPSHTDITSAISALTHILKVYTNNDSFNSELHLPPNPVLALLLSQYGRYVPGTRGSRVYSYMAANNIHNNKPFGTYKINREEDPSGVH